MKSIFTRRNKVLFPYPELILNFILIIILLRSGEQVFLSFGIIVFLCIHSIILFVKAGVSKAFYELKKSEYVSQKRLELIKEIIAITSKYEPDKRLLHKKICETVKIRKLKDASIINTDSTLKKINKVKLQAKLSPEELEFMVLLDKGFSPRELSVIYNMTNHRSAYIKRKRILNKIQGISVND